MKREIEFRGLHKISGREVWVYGFLFIDGKDYFINQPHTSYSVIPESVGQFTNLKDKNKKKIYEGDIISFSKRMHEVKISFNGYYLQRYKLWNGKFLPAFSYSMSLITKPSKSKTNIGGIVEEAEIVGNIYQHPELLT